eukprot:CCRYP_012476-RA/>CCRYP_012476-RA protein AED:0.44 eAED:0.44 QI:0/0/0/1/0/0/3/0/288
MEWFDCSLPLRPPGGLDSKDFDAMEDIFFIQAEDELFGNNLLSCYVNDILDAKYEWTDVAEVADKQTHLNAHQRRDLLQVLQDNSKMFDGTLGLHPLHKVQIELVPDVKPVHARPYPDGRVHWVSDLRQLNKVIKQRQFLLPIIFDILCKCSEYKFFTKLDVSLQCYTFELDKESQDLSTIIAPFGKYKYARLPMGLKCSPDIAHSVMESVLSGIEDADMRLQENGFTINPLKCEWAVQETDWLGYWLTPRDLKPRKQKIEAIPHMDRPCHATELRLFIGCINYYHDM